MDYNLAEAYKLENDTLLKKIAEQALLLKASQNKQKEMEEARARDNKRWEKAYLDSQAEVDTVMSKEFRYLMGFTLIVACTVFFIIGGIMGHFSR